jgi:hypothetical protein
VLGKFGAAKLLHDHREEAGGGGEVERAVERLTRFFLEAVEHGPQLAVDRLVVEGPGHVLEVVQQALQDVLVGLAPGKAPDRLLALLAVVLVLFFFARDAHQVETLGQRALVGEVVERRQQFASGQIAGRAEDDQGRWSYRQPLQPSRQWVLGLGLAGWAAG